MEHAKRRVTGHYFGDTVIYECKLGYVLKGNTTSRCNSDGHWTAPPDCEGECQ